jgi:hypothetical protein
MYSFVRDSLKRKIVSHWKQLVTGHRQETIYEMDLFFQQYAGLEVSKKAASTDLFPEIQI